MPLHVVAFAVTLSLLGVAAPGQAETLTIPTLSAPPIMAPALGQPALEGGIQTKIEENQLAVSAPTIVSPIIFRMVEIAPEIYAKMPPSVVSAHVQDQPPLEGSGPAPTLSAEVAVEPPPRIDEALTDRQVLVIYDIHFEFDRATIIDSAAPSIRHIGEAMVANPSLRIRIEGHTDAKGDAIYNKALAQRRAESVKAAIMQQFGIADDRITAVGQGEEDPIAPNDTDAGRAINRRVEVQIQ